MTKPKFLLVSIFTFILIGSMAFPVTVTNAAPPPQEEHCVLHLDPWQPGEASSNAYVRGCYATFEEAIYHATSGRVKLPPGFNPADLTDDILNGRNRNNASSFGIHSMMGTLSSTVIGIDWDWTDYDNNSRVYEVSEPLGCDDPSVTGYGLSDMGTWKDKAESAKSFAGCDDFIHYEDTNFGGVDIETAPECADMGIMRNEAESLTWDEANNRSNQC